MGVKLQLIIIVSGSICFLNMKARLFNFLIQLVHRGNSTFYAVAVQEYLLLKVEPVAVGNSYQVLVSGGSLWLPIPSFNKTMYNLSSHCLQPSMSDSHQLGRKVAFIFSYEDFVLDYYILVSGQAFTQEFAGQTLTGFRLTQTLVPASKKGLGKKKSI